MIILFITANSYRREKLDNMNDYEYMKIIDIIASTLGAEKKFDVRASHDLVDIYDVSFDNERGDKKNFRFFPSKDEMRIEIEINFFEKESAYRKWLNRLEYALEQSHKANIKIRTENIVNLYRITFQS